jgi:hypothetical protein
MNCIESGAVCPLRAGIESDGPPLTPPPSASVVSREPAPPQSDKEDDGRKARGGIISESGGETGTRVPSSPDYTIESEGTKEGDKDANTEEDRHRVPVREVTDSETGNASEVSGAFQRF